MKKIFFFLFISTICFSQNEVDSLSYYFKSGNFNKAIIYGEKQKKEIKVKDNNYAILLNNLAGAYLRIDKFDYAELNYLETLELVKSYFGEINIIVANTYRNLGNVYSANLELEKAKENYLKALEIIEKISGSNALEYSEFLLDLAITYKDLKDYVRAENSYLKVCELFLKNKGENDITYQKSLISSAIFYKEINDLEKAEDYFLKSYRLQKANLRNETISTFIFTIDTIALFYNNKNLLDLAEKFYLESLIIKEKYYGENNLDYIQSLINLGMLYTKVNNNVKSIKYLEKANKRLISVNKEYSADNAFVINSLANKMSFAGKYEDAERLIKKVIEIHEKLNLKSVDYFDAKIKLALNYQNQGDFDNSEKVFLDIIKSTKNINDYAYFNTLHFVVDYYIEMENKAKAEKYIFDFEELYSKLKPTLKEFDIIHIYYYRALQSYYASINQHDKALKFAFNILDLTERNPLFGSKSIAYFRTISDIGLLYKSLGNYVDWKVYKFKAYNFIKDKIGKNPRNDASLLIDIANVYKFENNVVEAEKHYLEALKILDNNVNIKIKLYDDALLNIVSFYFDNKSSKTNVFLEKLILKNKLDLEKYIGFLSEKEFLNIKHLVDRGRTFSNYFLQSYPSQHPEINTASYENHLLLKNLSLRNQQRIKNSIAKSNNTELKEKYQQFIDNKRYITKLDELAIAERPSNYQQLIADTENLEKDITRLSSEFADAKKALSINWKQVQEKLKPNEIAIDLVDYNYYNKKWTDSVYYSAFIIKRDSKFPKFITLFEENQLKSLLTKINNPDDKIRNNKLYSEKAISDLFLKPLENELKNISTVYFSPSGLGHQIDFNALPINEKQLFGEKYKVHVLSSPSELIDYKTATLTPKNNLELVLYGGIDYNKSLAKANQIENQNLVTSNKTFEEFGNRGGYGKLEGTLKEIEEISQNAQKYGFRSKLFKEGNATEESIKGLDGIATPYVLHIATHGFFFENIKQEIPKDIISIEKKHQSFENPMLRSGLLLAGANKFWTKNTEQTTTDDGVLTASEISNLDLSACQLVVLSACETGLGQINGSEGVFGLQRAFKMAGVKNIIMSLWKVPDDQTAELFNLFYEECFAGKTIHDAFQTAQTKMQAKYAPYYWAGFILLE
jgi:CHAT domain-containing protein/tetratricopeptide (TPR) repeat protein